MMLPKMFNETIVQTNFAPDLLGGGGQADDAGAGGGGDGGAGDGGDGGGAGGDGGDGGGGSAPEWLGGVSEDLRASEGLDAYKSLDDLVKDHVNLRGKVGAIPEAAEGYAPPEGIQEALKGIDGVDADQVIKAWQENAAKYGMPLTTAQKLLTDEVERAKTSRTENEQRVAEHIKGKVAEATTTLKTEWKGDFQKNLDMADRALASVFSKEAVEAIKLSGMAFNVNFIKDLHRLAPHVTEDVIDNLGNQAGKPSGASNKTIADRLYN